MKKQIILISSSLFTLTIASVLAAPLAKRGDATDGWKMHDMKRPQPVQVEAPDVFTAPPSDAILLLGNDEAVNRDAWKNTKWTFADSIMTVAPKTGDSTSKQSFGDCQLHVEFQIPALLNNKTNQSLGNSGIYLMSTYEAQVLATHSKDNTTYCDGMTGAIYGQNPPLVNASHRIGEWNTYDIVFRRPHFNEDGSLKSPAIMTVFLNGVLVQDHFELLGPTSYMHRQPYKAHADKLPLRIQDHSCSVNYRNIWVRPLD